MLFVKENMNTSSVVAHNRIFFRFHFSLEFFSLHFCSHPLHLLRHLVFLLFLPIFETLMLFCMIIGFTMQFVLRSEIKIIYQQYSVDDTSRIVERMLCVKDVMCSLRLYLSHGVFMTLCITSNFYKVLYMYTLKFHLGN